MADKTHLYNLKAVIKEVGLSPAVLRAWERRYGLLKPQRSPGGHRLYSRQDIEMLKWLVERQMEGLSISSAVEMWKSQQSNYQDILRQFQATMPVVEASGTLIDQLRNAWLAACMAFDDQSASRALDQVFAIAPPETICTEVLQKGLVQMGDYWYTGSASIQHEHFATVIAIRRINALMAAVTPPGREGRILVACPPGEGHSFVLLLIAYLLRRRGWNVVYLGSDVPLIGLEATIQSITPILIISSAQTLSSAASLRAMAETLAVHRIPLAFGGGIFALTPGLTRCIAGYYLGDEVAPVPQVVEQLLASSPSLLVAQEVAPEYIKLLATFNQNQALISAFAVSALQARQFDSAYLELADYYPPQLIIAALKLGDINLIGHSIKWLNGLLQNYGFSMVEARELYSAYSLAIDRYLGGEGAIIHDWLAEHILSA